MVKNLGLYFVKEKRTLRISVGGFLPILLLTEEMLRSTTHRGSALYSTFVEPVLVKGERAEGASNIPKGRTSSRLKQMDPAVKAASGDKSEA